MCGIVGYVGHRNCGPILLDAIKKLEYRGYDSVGMAVIGDGLQVKKDSGKIDDVQSKVHFHKMKGRVGIAHTRWSTHGVPNHRNSHPHLDCSGKIAVVHNGIIENFAELREELKSKGHVLISDTDTEVIAHLVEDALKQTQSLEQAVEIALSRLEGSYAVAVIYQKEPGKLVAARRLSPLVVGVNGSEYFVASDIPAFLNFTNKAIPLHDNDLAILTFDGLKLKKMGGSKITREPYVINWTPEMAEKSGYPHFMIKEIHEQPRSLRETFTGRQQIKKILQHFKKGMHIIACGTSYHAAIAGKYAIEALADIPVEITIASEFIKPHFPLLVISQSGETADTLRAMREAKVPKVALTNVVGSTITRESDDSIFTFCGPEIGVAATKTYTAQLMDLFLLASELGGGDTSDLFSIPQLIAQTLKLDKKIKSISKWLSKQDHVYFIGRGPSLSTALEGALKLKEISYIHAEGMAAGELKHGTLALIEAGVPVVVIAPKGKWYEKTISSLMEVKSRGGKIIALGEEGDTKLQELADEFIGLPKVREEFSPIPYIIPLQLLAYHCGVERGCDVDKPRNLAKSVTVE
jgi:glucosamine--fructose-6-phosphate aminotransferase (isomerizing)